MSHGLGYRLINKEAPIQRSRFILLNSFKHPLLYSRTYSQIVTSKESDMLSYCYVKNVATDFPVLPRILCEIL